MDKASMTPRFNFNNKNSDQQSTTVTARYDGPINETAKQIRM
jgi:hypothetical protein